MFTSGDMRTSTFWTLRWDRGCTIRIGRLLLLLLLVGAYGLLFPRSSKNEGRHLAGVAGNLLTLEGAKERWALEHHATNGALPTMVDLAPYLKDGNRILERAKERWYQDHRAFGALPTPADLTPYLKLEEFFKPAVGEIYAINPVGERITATLTREVAGWYAGRVLTVESF